MKDDEDVEESIEDQIARELEGMQSTHKGKGEDGSSKRNKARFSTVKTNTECREPVFLSNYVPEKLQI